MITLIRLGDRVFNPALIEEIDLRYPPKKYDKHKPPSPHDGVEIILASGRRLDAFWDAEAQVLRDYLNGEAVTSRRTTTDDGLAVVELVPAEVEPEVARAFVPEASWGLDESALVRESAPIVRSIP